jgi:glutaminase
MTHAVPDLKIIVREIADDIALRPDRGEVASYIPELASVHNKRFGLVVIDAAGNVAAAGDSEMPFSIQSISKVFTLTLALGLVGDKLWQRVGRERRAVHSTPSSSSNMSAASRATRSSMPAPSPSPT